MSNPISRAAFWSLRTLSFSSIIHCWFVIEALAFWCANKLEDRGVARGRALRCVSRLIKTTERTPYEDVILRASASLEARVELVLAEWLDMLISLARMVLEQLS
jgi:hypothetical protein